MRRVEQEERGLFQIELSAEEARYPDPGQRKSPVFSCEEPVPLRTTPRESSRGDRDRTPCHHGVFGSTTLETFSRADKGESDCKDRINGPTTPKGFSRSDGHGFGSRAMRGHDLFG